MKTNKEDKCVNQIDEEDFFKRKRSSFYENNIGLNTTNQGDDDIKREIMLVDCLSFTDILEKTEEVLLHELSINPPGKHGIGKYKFGSVFDNNVVRLFSYDWYKQIFVASF